MATKILGIKIPGHKSGRAPDSKAVGKKLDDLIKQYFMGKKVVIRCIGSQDHPGITLRELVDIVVKTGTDKYDTARTGVGYDGFLKAGKHIDFYGEDLEITKDTSFMPNQLYEMYHSAIGDRGYGVHVDLVLVYDMAQLSMVMNLYDHHSTSDGFVFKDPANKQATLLGVIKIE